MRDYQYYKSALQGIPLPYAFLDRDVLNENIHDILSRSKGKSIRLASKSIRSIGILRYIFQASPQFQGIMCYSPWEAIYLAKQGFQDLLLGYPVWDTTAIVAVTSKLKEDSPITFMVDCLDHVKHIEGIAEKEDVLIPLCVDLDMSSTMFGLHFGVHRSPLRTTVQALEVFKYIASSRYVYLDGIMGYEAQIAGLGDRYPSQTLKNKIVRFLKERSIHEVVQRRSDIVREVRSLGIPYRFINGGGTGSLRTTTSEEAVTEVTVGSGFYAPGLFDNYQDFRYQPALGFAIEIVRIPAPSIYTCLGGGYVASGATGNDKLPKPYLPQEATLLKNEGAGEVQTPIMYKGEESLQLGDPIFMRHSKAGELCERFTHLLIVSEGKVMDKVTTYRGGWSMLSVTEEKAKEWTNWSGSVKSYPASILFPSSIQEVVEIVKAASQQNKKIRVVGAGHSFTRLVQTNEILISLENLHGVEKLDKEKGLAEVWAGTNLKELGEALYELGVSQENLGDINSQSIAGAISTGTHGTGIAFGSISTQVAAITAVNASGEVLDCSDEENPNLFKAFQVSLGTLGIIVKVTLRVVPKLHLSYKCYRTKLTDCLERLVPLKQENRHFEFYWFPYTDTVQVKLMNKTNEASFKNNKWSEWKKLALENGIYWLLSEVCRLLPSMSKTISRISAIGVPSIEESGPSHLLFATPRLVRFNEMEYSIPAEHLRAALEEMKKCIETHQFAVHFPIECRYVKRDDIWLSPANERDSAYIAVHMYKGMSHEEYFYHIEKILQKYEGRPHWGKIHTMTPEQLQKIYPKWNTFLHIREELDPAGLFLNDYLCSLLA